MKDLVNKAAVLTGKTVGTMVGIYVGISEGVKQGIKEAKKEIRENNQFSFFNIICENTINIADISVSVIQSNTLNNYTIIPINTISIKLKH